MVMGSSMGKGAIVNILRKHKMNVASSTESELVSISDVLGMLMWCKYFMEAQGYTIENNILYQYNNSTILLAKKGRMLAGKNSKHIKNKCFPYYLQGSSEGARDSSHGY